MTDWRGKFVWHELSTTDMAAAETFYKAVLGVTARDAGMPDMSYTLFSIGETPVCGLMTVPEKARAAGQPSRWMGYIAVDDVDDSAAEVVRNGGAIHHPASDIPGVGRFAVVSDPQGAVFTLFKAAMAEGNPPPPGTPGTIGWSELSATDPEAAFGFYSKLFGWTKDQTLDMGPAGIYQLFTAGGQTTGGIMTKPPSASRPFWLYYFNVDGIDAAVERVTKGGGQILHGPNPVPGGSWVVQGADPQGAMFGMASARR